jgi:hypothetical protein
VNFVQHPSNNKVLGAPPNWDQSKTYCNALPVTSVVDGERVSLVSYWQPTPEELDAIKAGAPIMLWIHSAVHPVVSLGVEGTNP